MGDFIPLTLNEEPENTRIINMGTRIPHATFEAQ